MDINITFVVASHKRLIKPNQMHEKAFVGLTFMTHIALFPVRSGSWRGSH